MAGEIAVSPFQTVGAATAARHAITSEPRPAAKSAARRLPAHLLLPPLLLFIVLTAQLFVRLTIVHRSYELQRVRSEALRNDAELRGLRLELATLTSPSVIAERAGKELELRPVSPQRIRRVTGGARQ